MLAVIPPGIVNVAPGVVTPGGWDLRPVADLMPWPDDYQVMHVKLFPHGVFHAENVGGRIDEVLNQKVWVGCFPFRFKGREAAFSRFVAFVEKK